MLSIKNRKLLRKLNQSISKRNDALLEGNYELAVHYGKLVDRYIELLKLEEGVPQ